MPVDVALVNGHRIRYRLEGAADGPLVVFGHGLLGSIEQIEQHAPVLNAFYERIRLLVYDARGHGQSEGPEDPAACTWETLGRDMTALATAHGEGPAVLGGGSMGAATALWAALEQPEHVRALVLAMPPPLGRHGMREQAEHNAIRMLDFLAAAIQNYGLEQTVEIVRQAPGFAPTPEEADQRARWLLTAPYHDPEDYRRINVPTLIVAHEGDGLHPMRAAKLLADRIPNSRLITGDYPGFWRTHTEDLHAELRTFLDHVG